ncbi:MAG TPA: arginase family protein [Candidatus Deferrimicrobium sp.]|nr:arginase family protein [Candidatus Deferrimicrobium sp.]
MVKYIKVFGAALDPSDSGTKVLIKRAHLDALATGREEKSKYFDPYDAFITESKILQRPNFKKIGKFPIESWLRPKPDLEDHIFMTPLDFRIFLDSNGCKEYADAMEKFIEQKVFPDIPLMIGADHSLTGGVLKALSKKYGAENIAVIILDGHFDAIPTFLRLELAKYSQEHKNEVQIPFPELIDSIDETTKIPLSYNCGTFLYHLMEQKVVDAQHLIVFGTMDYPSDEIKAIQDPRVKQYVDFYLSYQKKGITIIPNYKDNERMKTEFKEALEKLNTPYLYLSIDVDVSSLKAVLAARFMEFFGVDEEGLKNAADLIRKLVQSKKIEIIGLDLMEIEVYYLNAILKSGKSDKTIAVMDNFLESILF